MTEPADPTPPHPTEPTDAQRRARSARGPDREAEAERRRRRDRVFGAVLADTTSDERDEGPSDDGSRDAELRRNVPPHHG